METEVIEGVIETPAAVVAPAITEAQLETRITAVLEERARKEFTPPPVVTAKPVMGKGQWMSLAVRSLAGDRIPELEIRALAELVISDNLGVVPNVIAAELLGVIDKERPFLNATRHMETPVSGTKLVIPKIGTRPTVGVQAAEKDAIVSTIGTVTSVEYDMLSYFGGGDISLQLLKRSDPSFLSLYLELLAEAYALVTEQAAVTAAIAPAGVVEGGALDPEVPTLGQSWTNSMAAVKVPPTHIFLASAATALFIDAKDLSGRPLYASGNPTNSDGTANAANGLSSISGLIPVLTPALDAGAVDVLVGPAKRGFYWAEDGTFTLQADNVAQGGRDVAIGGFIWFAPVVPAAWTSYTI